MAARVAQRKNVSTGQIGNERSDAHPVDGHSVDDVIEKLCQAGCKIVLQKIDAMERGESIAECASLGRTERHFVLRELKSIMAVYGNVCRL